MSEAVLLVCPRCEAVNRVPSARLGDRPNCGKCKDGLFQGHPVEVQGPGFQRFLEKNQIPVLVDFWAPWCGPCKMMMPVLEQAAALLEPRVRVAKLNTEAEQAVAAQHRIQSIPTLALFRGGLEIARQPGAVPLQSLLAWVQSHL